MIHAYLRRLHCDEETDEVGADEPYVLATTVNLAATASATGRPVPVPAVEVVRYGPFDDVDEDETHGAPSPAQSFWGPTGTPWGPTGTPATLENPDHAIFVVALMENDNGDPEALRGFVKGIVGGSVLGSLGFDRADKVASLIRDVDSALGTPTGAPNFDDKVGAPQELRFSHEDLRLAELGATVAKDLVFAGDGGRYILTFEARNPAPNGFALFGAIREKWEAVGGPRSPPGLPVSPETPTFDAVGRVQSFERGIVSWHPETGAHIVWGLIGGRWLEMGREAFGYPITDEEATADGRGRFNHFQALQFDGKPIASIHWHPDTGAHATFGAIRAKWAEMGWEESRLGYPVAGEEDRDGGRSQRFQGGALFWTAQGGVVVQ